MSSQAEKTIPGGDQQPSTATLDNSAPDIEYENEELPRKKVNGGLDAWLSVLAGFCIFVNSW